MSQRTATVVSLPMAFEMVKAMQADGLQWDEDCRPLARKAIAEIIEDRMAEAVDAWLDGLDADASPDRRNGYYRRQLLTELGDIEFSVPRTRRYIPCPSRESYPRVVMMQSGQDWYGDHGPRSLDGSSQRRVLAQCQVCTRLVVITKI